MALQSDNHNQHLSLPRRNRIPQRNGTGLIAQTTSGGYYRHLYPHDLQREKLYRLHVANLRLSGRQMDREHIPSPHNHTVNLNKMATLPMIPTAKKEEPTTTVPYRMMKSQPLPSISNTQQLNRQQLSTYNSASSISPSNTFIKIPTALNPNLTAKEQYLSPYKLDQGANSNMPSQNALHQHSAMGNHHHSGHIHQHKPYDRYFYGTTGQSMHATPSKCFQCGKTLQPSANLTHAYGFHSPRPAEQQQTTLEKIAIDTRRQPKVLLLNPPKKQTKQFLSPDDALRRSLKQNRIPPLTKRNSLKRILSNGSINLEQINEETEKDAQGGENHSSNSTNNGSFNAPTPSTIIAMDNDLVSPTRSPAAGFEASNMTVGQTPSPQSPRKLS